MAKIPPSGGGGGGTTQSSSTQQSSTNIVSSLNFADWHKALLWFLGGITLIAIAGPAPSISTWLVVILIFWVLLKNWSDYAMFLGLANTVTGGSQK